MRLSWSSLLWVPLLASFGCDSADSCGPTSEWPTCNQGSDEEPGEPTTGAGPEDEDQGAGPPKSPGQNTGGGKKDAGRPAISLDAGILRPEPSTPTGDGEFGAIGADGGSDAGPDASVPIGVDGGMADCTMDSDGRSGGACYGVYCDTPATSFRYASRAGACTGDEDLALACDGEIARVVAQCAQDDAVSLGFGRTVALCAGRAPGLAAASEGCISCYVDEVLCAVQECLASCLGGTDRDCTSCRLEHCGAAFVECTGLPAPR